MTDTPMVGAAGSLAAQLRQHASQLAAQTGEFDMPGWNGDVALEVRRLDRRSNIKLEKVRDPFDRAVRVIAMSTVALIVRDGDSEHRYESWAEFGAGALEVPDGTSTSEIVRMMLPADALLGALVERIGSWAADSADQEVLKLGE